VLGRGVSGKRRGLAWLVQLGNTKQPLERQVLAEQPVVVHEEQETAEPLVELGAPLATGQGR
jgi:hypothetical protein